MTVTNFEHITEELSEVELKIIPVLIAGFKTVDKKDPIKAPAIVNKVNQYFSTTTVEKEKGIRITEARLRKCVNYIRSKSLLPLIATSEGYYTSYDKEEIKKQIKSLEERANSILTCSKGLYKFVN